MKNNLYIKKYIQVVFLALLVIVIGLGLGGFAPFGDKDLLSSFGKDIYYPKGVSLIGINIISALIILASTVSFFVYLSFKECNHFSKFVFSLAYGLTGCFFFGGAGISADMAIAVFPIFMTGAEKLYHDRKPILYIISLSILSAMDFNVAIISIIFSFLYFLTYDFLCVRHFFVTMLKKFISDILTIGIFAIFLVINPSNKSFRIEHSMKFPEFSVDLSLNRIFELFSKSGASAGIIVGLVCFLYVFKKDYSKQKIKKIFLYALLLSGCFVSATEYFLNGFSDKVRLLYSFTLVFFTLEIAAEYISEFDKEESKRKHKKILLYLILAETVLGCLFKLAVEGKKAVPFTETQEYHIRSVKEDILEKDEHAKIIFYDGVSSYPDPVSRVLGGYRYVIAPSGVEMDSSLDLVDTVYGLDVYKDEKLESGIQVYSEAELKSVLDSDYPFYGLIDLVNDRFGIDDIYVTAEDDIRVVPDMTDKTYRTTNLYVSYQKKEEYYSNLYDRVFMGNLNPGDEGLIICHKSVEDLKGDILKRHSVYLDKEKYNALLEALDTDQSARMGETEEKNNKSIWPIGLVITLISLALACFYIKFTKNSKSDISDNKNALEKFVSDNIVYFYTLIITMTVYFIILAVNQCMPFGNNSAVISDGLISDYPTNTYTVQNLRSLNFKSVDFVLGFQWGGIGLSSFWYFLNPVRLVQLLFPASKSLLGFNVFYMLEFLLIGPSMLLYLTHRPCGGRMDKHERKLVPIALCYNLSSFVLSYYSFNGFLEIAMILPIIMLAMERLIYKKKYILYTIVLSLFIIEATYYAFMLCIFLFLYFFTMEHKNFATFFRNGLRFAAFSLISAGMASFTLFSFYVSVMNSGYAEGDSAAGAAINVFTQNMAGSLSDFEVIHRITRATVDSQLANTYCGLLLLIAIPLFMFVKRISLSSRIRRVILMLILYFAYGNELLNFVFHGFHFQTMVPNRFSIFFIFMMVTVFYDVICNYKDIYNKNAILSFSVFSVVILLGIYFQNKSSLLPVLVSVGFIIGYYLIVFSGFTKGEQYKKIKILEFALCMELLISTVYSAVSAFAYFEQTMFIDSYKTIKRLSDEYSLNDGLFRTSIISDGGDNRACLTGIKTVDIFSSSLQQEQINLASAWNISPDTNCITYGYGNPLADVMLNVKYYIIKSNTAESLIPTYLEPLKTRNNLTLYENPYVISDSKLLPLALTGKKQSNYDDMSEYQNEIAKTVVGDNLYDLVETENVLPDEDMISDEKNYIDVSKINDEGDIAISVSTMKGLSGDIYVTVSNRLVYIGNVDGEEVRTAGTMLVLSDVEKAKFKGADADYNAKVYILNMDTYNKIKEYQIENKTYGTEQTADSILMKTSSEKESILYIPVLESEGWRAYVDGNVVEREDIFGGVGIPVDSGMYDVELKMTGKTDYRRYIISIVSVMLLLGIFFYDKKSEKVDEISVK